jgi:hypothetical protein
LIGFFAFRIILMIPEGKLKPAILKLVKSVSRFVRELRIPNGTFVVHRLAEFLAPASSSYDLAV